MPSLFNKVIFQSLNNSFIKSKEKDAFYINGKFYTYSNFIQVISKIRFAVQTHTRHEEKIVGLILNDDIETYASIIALWFEGKAYVPINLDNPVYRNEKIIQHANICTIINSGEKTSFSNCNEIFPKNVSDVNIDLLPLSVSDNEIAYIFFTSGTTGEPKGVPIKRYNVASFINSFEKLKLDINEEDKVLQMFDLTFDLSVMSFLMPMLKGACIYTIPRNVIKFNYIIEMIEEHNITVALMVPSILHYLRKYFDEISAPNMKYNLFCGEALHLDIIAEWSKCIPNAEIFNVYGPTENTIFCTSYHYNRNSSNKEYNGILSIGKPMWGVITIIVDDQNSILPHGERGELCLAGEFLTPGYWKNEERNKEAFFFCEYNGEKTRFYKTGDLCVQDIEGDIMYLGRIDFQTKIQGYRVELSEIEFHAKRFINTINLVALAITNNIGNNEIAMVFESNQFDTTELFKYMAIKLPAYMIPTKWIFEIQFPLNTNGKIDRKILVARF